jgi:hypothetical protein
MNRRKFVKTAALVPLMASGSPLLFASLPAAEAGKGAAKTTPQGDLRARYELTLQRVLEGNSPALSEEFLLADLRPVAARRFTEYSGDLSGRYIGALATAAQADGTHFPGLDELVQKAIALEKPDGYFGSTFHYDKPADGIWPCCGAMGGCWWDCWSITA